MATILLIEPDIPLAHIYQQAFEQAGHTVHHASSAQGGIDLADAATPDVIVVELQMPAHNGVSFLYELHSYAEWQHIPVIINTLLPLRELANVRDVLAEQLQVRVVHYKPHTSLTQLLQSVEDTLLAEGTPAAASPSIAVVSPASPQVKSAANLTEKSKKAARP